MSISRRCKWILAASITLIFGIAFIVLAIVIPKALNATM